MATRTPHTGVANEVLTAANLAKYPKGVVAFDTGTASNIGTTEVDVAAVTFTAGSDRMYRVTGTASITGGTTAVGGNMFIEEGTSDLGRVHRHPDSTAQSFCAGSVLVNPTAGAHTYKLVGVCDTSGDFDCNVVAAKIVVEDVGPAFS